MFDLHLKAPPELWEVILPTLEPEPEGNPASTPENTASNGILTPFLRLKHVFVAQLRGDRFAKAPAIFGGMNENLVLRAGAARRVKPSQSSTSNGTGAAKRHTPADRSTSADAAAAQFAPWWKKFFPGMRLARASGTAALQVMRRAQEALIPDDTVPTIDPVPPHIFCWERETGVLLYCIQFPHDYGNITSFAWNPAHGTSMFVIGTEDGDIHVWSKSQPVGEAEPAPSFPEPAPSLPTTTMPSTPSPEPHRRRITLRRT